MKRIAPLVLVLLAGLAAASMFSSPARAYDIATLPAGYSVATLYDAAVTCGYTYTISGYGSTLVLKSDRSFAAGSCDPDFQSKLDAFVSSTCPCAQTTTTTPAAATTTIATTSTSAQATTTPATSTSTTTATTPAATPSTTTAPTTSTTAPAVTTAPTTTTTTTPETTTVPATTTAPTTTTVVTTTEPAPAPVPVSAPVPPVASFTSVASASTASFTDSSRSTNGGIATITWHFGDGGNGTGLTVSHTYPRAGIYTVIEIVTDQAGLTDQATVDVSVGSPAKAAVAPAASKKAAPTVKSASGQPAAKPAVKHAAKKPVRKPAAKPAKPHRG